MLTECACFIWCTTAAIPAWCSQVRQVLTRCICWKWCHGMYIHLQRLSDHTGNSGAAFKSGSQSPDDKACLTGSHQQGYQPAVLYTKVLVSSEGKPVSVVFRQAAYVQRPEKPGRLTDLWPCRSAKFCSKACAFRCDFGHSLCRTCLLCSHV